MFNYTLQQYIYTIFFAKKGKKSIAAALVLQFLSIANSVKAGKRDCESESISMTFVRSSKCLKRLTLTSEKSSLNNIKKICKIWSFVPFFPTIGHKERSESASDALTCCKGSFAKEFKQGTILWITSTSSKYSENFASLNDAIVLSWEYKDK